MEDLRVSWMRDRVYAALGLRDEGLFVELLQREGARGERELLAYLDQPAEQLPSSALIFHLRKVLVDVEQDEEPERKNIQFRPPLNVWLSIQLVQLCITQK